MKERDTLQSHIPLFDEIPDNLKQRENVIKQTFDGTIGARGISFVLNPLNGAIIRARMVDLNTGLIKSYEPLARAKWANTTGDLKENSPEYEKLDRVYEDVLLKLKLWKLDNPGFGPMREWTTVKGRRYEDSNSKIIRPEEWFEKVSTHLVKKSNEVLEEEQEKFKEEKPRERKTHRTLTRQRTGVVKQSNTRKPDIVFSKDGPRIGDPRFAPANLRRNADRDTKRVLLDKGSLGKRVRSALQSK